MYRPLFNQVLVEVDTDGDKWGTGNDDSMLGKDYREGVVVDIGAKVPTNDYPINPDGLDALHELTIRLVDKQVMWNQGHEAGKTFEHDGKLYALVYWWDLVGVKE
jgi:hypothetical protein